MLAGCLLVVEQGVLELSMLAGSLAAGCPQQHLETWSNCPVAIRGLLWDACLLLAVHSCQMPVIQIHPICCVLQSLVV